MKQAMPSQWFCLLIQGRHETKQYIVPDSNCSYKAGLEPTMQYNTWELFNSSDLYTEVNTQ